MVYANMVPAGMVERGAELSGLPTRKVQNAMQEIWKEKGFEDYDPFLLFQHTRNCGLYQQSTKKEQAISALCCLVLLHRAPAEESLQDTIPTGNVIHALDRILARSMITEYPFTVYLLRYLLGCSARAAMTYADYIDSLPKILRSAKINGNIDGLAMTAALH